MKCGEAPVGRAVIGTASNAGIAMPEDGGSVRGTARLKLRAGEAKVFIGGDGRVEKAKEAGMAFG